MGKVTAIEVPDTSGDYIATDLSMDFAAAHLADRFGLDVEHQHEALIIAMANEMTEAWFDAGEQWMATYGPLLRTVPTFPRECWCGQWPPLGTDCWYHGQCACLSRVRRNDGVKWQVSRGYISGFDGDRHIPLPGICPVHPGEQVPAGHAEFLYEHLKRHEHNDGQPYGRPMAYARAENRSRKAL